MILPVQYIIICTLFDLAVRLPNHSPNIVPILSIIMCLRIWMNVKMAMAYVIGYSILMNILLFLLHGYPVIGWWMLFQWTSYGINILLGSLVKGFVSELGRNGMSHSDEGYEIRRSLEKIGLSLTSSTQFFLITNFGVWLTGNLYTYDINGLVDCYMAAIPFFRWQILSDIFFLLVITYPMGMMKLSRTRGSEYSLLG